MNDFKIIGNLLNKKNNSSWYYNSIIKNAQATDVEEETQTTTQQGTKKTQTKNAIMHVYFNNKEIQKNSSLNMTVNQRQPITVSLEKDGKTEYITQKCNITTTNSEACLITKGLKNQIVSAIKEGAASISVIYLRRSPFTFNLNITADQTASNMNFEKFIQGLQYRSMEINRWLGAFKTAKMQPWRLTDYYAPTVKVLTQTEQNMQSLIQLLQNLQQLKTATVNKKIVQGQQILKDFWRSITRKGDPIQDARQFVKDNYNLVKTYYSFVTQLTTNIAQDINSKKEFYKNNPNITNYLNQTLKIIGQIQQGLKNVNVNLVPPKEEQQQQQGQQPNQPGQTQQQSTQQTQTPQQNVITPPKGTVKTIGNKKYVSVDFLKDNGINIAANNKNNKNNKNKEIPSEWSLKFFKK